jgi:hypothetical protein
MNDCKDFFPRFNGTMKNTKLKSETGSQDESSSRMDGQGSDKVNVCDPNSLYQYSLSALVGQPTAG